MNPPPRTPREGTHDPGLFAVVGATGTGKSDLSLDLADALAARGEPAEIVNADAMQLYRGMDIGTAKLPVEDRRGIPHHLFDVLDVTEDAAVARYQRDARTAIRAIQDRGRHAILVGGSGLYVSSVLFDFRFPPRDEALRARLEAELAEHGAGALYARLQREDAATAARVDPQNGRRIVRALEILALGEGTHGAALPEEPVAWRPVTIVGLRMERPALIDRLDRRVERMWADGMLEETARLREQGLERGKTAARAIGYAQALAQLKGETTEAEAIAETQALTRRYARRQVSWFKRYSPSPGVDVSWFDAGAADPQSLADSIA
ncbi:tRNA (adenosine(37)-N6)-dimethylallyltransferase MiaA [Microbacterium sp. JZ31]|uniref:tRNA (adenosine(37)-N6)-dimethylallyltransferase MiaA n=1 Tax=Microbacterium sp. JZ31 TaxID=1906274 RepID=UPI001932B8B5|nr:tRNA (adenosine(37)-N6)-dimethylallyltransferase MiaA [Microbacterium sp. JZ31]